MTIVVLFGLLTIWLGTFILMIRQSFYDNLKKKNPELYEWYIDDTWGKMIVKFFTLPFFYIWINRKANKGYSRSSIRIFSKNPFSKIIDFIKGY